MFGKKKKEPPYVTAIIPAAGASSRMGGGNKLLMELDGVPVLGRTLLALEACDIIREIIVAASEDNIVTYADLGAALGITKLTKVVKGGATRQESVWKAALEASPRPLIWLYTMAQGRWSRRRWCKKPVKLLSFTAQLPQVFPCTIPSSGWTRTDISGAPRTGSACGRCRPPRWRTKRC